MRLYKFAHLFYKLCFARKHQIDPESSTFKLLLKIDTSPHHYLPISEMSPEELAKAKTLAENRYIELVPANHTATQDVERTPWGDIKQLMSRKQKPTERPLPERYVMLSGGSYALGTFDSDTLREEEAEMARQKREEMRAKKRDSLRL